MDKAAMKMVVRHTLMHLDPERLGEARESYESEEFAGVLRKQKGYRFNYLLESVDEPGEAISVIAWDTMDDAEVYEQSGLYADLVTKFGKWFTAQDVRGVRVISASSRTLCLAFTDL